jgi:hypothetical protein
MKTRGGNAGLAMRAACITEKAGDLLSIDYLQMTDWIEF